MPVRPTGSSLSLHSLTRQTPHKPSQEFALHRSIQSPKRHATGETLQLPSSKKPCRAKQHLAPETRVPAAKE